MISDLLQMARIELDTLKVIAICFKVKKSKRSFTEGLKTLNISQSILNTEILIRLDFFNLPVLTISL